MALVKCKECGKDVSTKAQACPNCGANGKSRPSGRVGKSLIIIFVILVLSTAISKLNTINDQTNHQEMTLTSEQAVLIDNLITSGHLVITPSLNKAQIDLAIWINLNANAKEGAGKMFAIYCANKKGNNLYWVEIYDIMSGKKLAKYSQSWGFKVY